MKCSTSFKEWEKQVASHIDGRQIFGSFISNKHNQMNYNVNSPENQNWMSAGVWKSKEKKSIQQTKQNQFKWNVILMEEL